MDLDEHAYMGLMAFSRKVGKAIEAAIACKRVGMTVIGLEVPHVHVHLVPRSIDDSAGAIHSMFDSDLTLTESELDELHNKLKI
jgi:histidine triad (HIT) family protein